MSRNRTGGNGNSGGQYAAFKSSVASMDAAALQSDIASRYNLPGSQLTIKRKPKAAKTSSHNSRGDEQTKYCQSCLSANRGGINVCQSCGYFMSAAGIGTVSLAQHRGLVKKEDSKTETLSQADWRALEENLAHRDDAYCPICMEGFNKGHEVLLSCSHMYHRNCLQSFEKFMKTRERCCPICRSCNYQKKVTHVGTRAFERVCAIIIQKNWRGHWCRCVHYELLRSFYRGKNGSTYKKIFFHKELASFTNRMERAALDRESEVQSMFQSMDKVMADNRQLDLEFELMLMERREFGGLMGIAAEDDAGATMAAASAKEGTGGGKLTEEYWKEILYRSKARKDGPLECAICMSDIHRGNRRVVLLSCSHLYHQRCILTLENFVKANEETSCPMCRSLYEKRLLSRCLQDFDSNMDEKR